MSQIDDEKSRLGWIALGLIFGVICISVLAFVGYKLVRSRKEKSTGAIFSDLFNNHRWDWNSATGQGVLTRTERDRSPEYEERWVREESPPQEYSDIDRYHKEVDDAKFLFEEREKFQEESKNGEIIPHIIHGSTSHIGYEIFVIRKKISSKMKPFDILYDGDDMFNSKAKKIQVRQMTYKDDESLLSTNNYIEYIREFNKIYNRINNTRDISEGVYMDDLTKQFAAIAPKKNSIENNNPTTSSAANNNSTKITQEMENDYFKLSEIMNEEKIKTISSYLGCYNFSNEGEFLEVYPSYTHNDIKKVFDFKMKYSKISDSKTYGDLVKQCQNLTNEDILKCNVNNDEKKEGQTKLLKLKAITNDLIKDFNIKEVTEEEKKDMVNAVHCYLRGESYNNEVEFLQAYPDLTHNDIKKAFDYKMKNENKYSGVINDLHRIEDISGLGDEYEGHKILFSKLKTITENLIEKENNVITTNAIVTNIPAETTINNTPNPPQNLNLGKSTNKSCIIL